MQTTASVHPTYKKFQKIRRTSEPTDEYVQQLCVLLQKTRDLYKARGKLRSMTMASTAAIFVLSYAIIHPWHIGMTEILSKFLWSGLPFCITVLSAISIAYAAGCWRYHTRIAKVEGEIEYLCNKAYGHGINEVRQLREAFQCLETLDTRLTHFTPKRVKIMNSRHIPSYS